MTINSIDLWTERNDNQLECLEGAFIDGFDKGIPYNSYRVIKNCNCLISTNYPELNITNKHHAVIFYHNNEPVRLAVLNKDSDVDKAIEVALEQKVNGIPLRSLHQAIGINRIDLNFYQQPIINKANHEKEIDVGSCDRPSLLNSMLQGSYTESDTGYGQNDQDIDFKFVPNISIQYELLTGDEHFIISHSNAFVNHNLTRIIPLQDNSKLDIEEIRKEYLGKGK